MDGCPPPGNRIELEAAARQRGAFLHVNKAEALSAQRILAHGSHIESNAIIANSEMKLTITLSEIASDLACFGVPDHVGQGFLGNAKTFRLQERSEPIFHRVDVELGAKSGQVGLAGDVPAQGWLKAEVVHIEGRRFNERSCTCSRTRSTA